MFTEDVLDKTITGLSYSGDIQMAFGEDRNKVSNIADAQMPTFRELYKPTLKSLPKTFDQLNGMSKKLMRIKNMRWEF
jgi:hypothetical protein